jgi:hypothetical protein
LTKSRKRINHLIVFKDNSINKILVLAIILLFVITSFSAAHPQNPTTITTTDDQTRGIVWDVTINFTEPGGAYDYAVFGEATDAHDGPPADAYDVLKPPAPMPPYIRTWLNDNLPFPYNKLWKDYRHSPGINKIWNLSVQWVPDDSVSPTTVTIVWDTIAINSTEYTFITLCTNGGTPLKNMLLESSYSFSCPANVPQGFKIICSVNQPPNFPGNPSPVNGTIGVSVNADLSWTGGDPDPGDTVTYDVYFGTSSSPPKVVSNQSGLSYNPPGDLLYNTLYYWRIVAWDTHDASAVGPLWHFTTGNQPPYVPSNPNPANGSTGVLVNADLSWSGGDPDPGDTVTYDVYFGTSSSPPKVVSNQSGLSYNPPGDLLYNTLYYWRIVAWDTHDASAVGPLWHFTTIGNQPPYVPSNPNPSNGSTGVSINADLSWSGGDPDPVDTVSYDVYFGTSSSPPKVVSNQSALSYDPGPLAYYTYYYWRIVAWDNHGASRAGPVWHFRTAYIQNRPPYAPHNPYPANGSTEVSVNVDLSWSGGDPDTDDFVTYDVYLGASLPLTKIASNKSSTTHALDHLLYNTKYYWKIVAWDNHQCSNASPLWSFTSKTDTTLPIVKITSPIKGYLYFNFGDVFVRKFLIFITTIIVGRVEVTATATDSQSGISRVEFYIDNELKANVTKAPYSWKWLEQGLIFPYTIKVKAYDCVGNSNPPAELRVWKIF